MNEKTIVFHVEQHGIGILQLNRPKANAINTLMLNELCHVLKKINEEPIKGLIITGKHPFFSAGLDVIELYQYDKDDIHNFWKVFLNVIEKLCALPIPVIAAISGHCPAGGCVLSLCADYRIMEQGNYRIGLNEVAVGVVVPPFIHELYASVIGDRQAYKAILSASLFNPEEAKAIGLVDEVVPEKQSIEVAKTLMSKLTNFNHVTWKKTKINQRAALVSKLADGMKQLSATLDHWWSTDGRASIEQLIKQLNKK